MIPPQRGQIRPLQAGFAQDHGDNYGLALAMVAAGAAIAIALLTSFGSEAHGVEFGEAGGGAR